MDNDWTKEALRRSLEQQAAYKTEFPDSGPVSDMLAPMTPAPISPDAVPYASERGRISHGEVEFREWYKVGGRTVVVTRDSALNDSITEWRYE